jgi:hypothetical protein
MVSAGHATRSAPREFYGGMRVGVPDAGAHEWTVQDTIFLGSFQHPAPEPLD